MGAVQKLATVVIIGLVAMATVITVYLADEPNRRESAEARDNQLAIERGTDLYIQFCLQCHGPGGLGSAADEDPSRIGPPLNQAHLDLDEIPVVFQSDDPADQALAEDFLEYMIQYGAPQDPRVTEKIMPAFGQDLNVRQMEDLIFLIMNGDWDYVYNQSVLETGQEVAEEICAEDPDDPICENIEDAPPVYPTVPPDEAEEAEDAPAGDDTPVDGDNGNDNDVTTLVADSPTSYDLDEFTAAPGETIEFVNDGAVFHDVAVDELGGVLAEAEVGDSVTFTIPEDAEPGEYEFYCTVPGHAEAGMVGTLIIEDE